MTDLIRVTRVPRAVRGIDWCQTGSSRVDQSDAGPASENARCAPQVSTGVTLRENNLKEIKDGKIMPSQGVLVGNRMALQNSPELLAIVHELIERFEAHLTAGARAPRPRSPPACTWMQVLG